MALELPADDLTTDVDYESPFIGSDQDDDDIDSMSSPYDADGPDMITEGGDPIPPESEEPPSEEHPVGKEGEAGDVEEEAPAEEGEEGEAEPPAEGEPKPESEPEPELEGEEPFIPKSRLDRQIRKTRQLEEQVQALIDAQDKAPATPDSAAAAAAKVPVVDMVAATKAALELALEGDVDGAATKLAEAQGARDEAVRQQAVGEVTEQLTERQVQQDLDAAKDRVEEKYSFLDSTDTEAFEADLVSDVVALRDSYISRGYKPGEALEAAAERIAKIEHPELFIKPDAPAEVPPKATPPKAKPDLAKKAKASQQQAPSTNDAGTTDASEKNVGFDIFALTEEDFDRLSETELAKLRGDFRT